MLARDGRDPRFSPDGESIAYWVGLPPQIVPRGTMPARMYVVPAAGGEATLFHPEFTVMRHPVWSPDGKYLVFSGLRDQSTPSAEWDWWVAPIDEGNTDKDRRSVIDS